ncbi:hypothetical protein ACK3SF_02465 [Candidatus Nanosalina sp. VS9-1]|uniref:hypothetical protein n=1 Tax=Candidatus Nanosalina sp. VS9-1 TaxID=3388566 RepID=UPI0039DFCC2E
MNISSLLNSLSEMNTAVLLLALVVLFVVAFKVMEMVMQTVLVTALSGAFYFALSYFLSSVTFSLNSLLFFAFIGGTLYTAYNLLTKSYKVATLLLKIPLKLIGIARGMIKSLISRRKKDSKKEEKD